MDILANETLRQWGNEALRNGTLVGVRARFDFAGADTGPIEFARPRSVITARRVEDVRAAFLAAQAALDEGRWVAGWVAYEAAPAFDHALACRPPSEVPLVCVGVFDAPAPADALAPGASRPEAPTWTPTIDRAAHAAGVAAIREAIARGDTYQINYTFPLEARVDVIGLDDLYRHLAWQARAPYAAFVEDDEWAMLSLSPELFFRTDGVVIETRPMKGTAARGRWLAEDRAIAEALAQSQKNRAENVMIVDLCRNDLTRVCETGSVQATRLYDVERYPTVWQMVSTVEGRLRSGTTLTDIFAALFPAGSITGAPKSSSMRLIAELERQPRGVYCGAMGYAAPGGRAVFNVAIRTMTVDRTTDHASYGVGGGITWDSRATDEHAEAIQKAACLIPERPRGLIETLRYENGECVRLDLHLARLRDSADYLGIPISSSLHLAISRSPQLAISPPRHLLRVRVVCDPSGAVSVTTEPFEPVAGPVSIALADKPVSSGDVRLFHKTTDRAVYDAHRAKRPDVFDVLLWNERGELTEFTRGNVVLEIDGVRVTPARSCGLLAGVFRQELLDAGDIHEAVIPVTDLDRARQVWFINSLREWVEVYRLA